MITYILLTILASAFFSGMEIAYVSSSRLRFELDKRNNSILGFVLHLYQRSPENFISTMLVGNNIALVLYGILMADLLNPLAVQLFNNQAFVFLFQTFISTLIILITAEFLPKTLFQIDPNFFIRIFSVPLLPVYLLLYPISKTTSLISKSILRLLGVRVKSSKGQHDLTKVDLDYFVQQSLDRVKSEVDLEPEVKIFQNALDFRNVKLRDCIIPRTEIIAAKYGATLDEITTVFIEKGISRLIIYRDNIDNIIGFFHASEIFNKPSDWHSCIRPLPIVPETMSASKLMRSLMLDKKSMAVVVDEFGGTAGIVTLEDLMEEFLGEIEDEYDVRRLVAKQGTDGSYILSGRIDIDRANELTELSLPESDDYHTVAGYILHHTQCFPQLNETIVIGDYTIKILKVSANKIELLNFKKNSDR